MTPDYVRAMTVPELIVWLTKRSNDLHQEAYLLLHMGHISPAEEKIAEALLMIRTAGLLTPLCDPDHPTKPHRTH